MSEASDKVLERHYTRCFSDYAYYSANNLKVQTESSTLEPFTLHEVQLLLEEIWADIEASGRLVRLYILKARRQGVSTWATGRFFWLTSCRPNKNTVLVAHEPTATEYLFGMQQRYLLNLPPEFQPQTLKNNSRALLFNNEKGTGLDSAIRCGTAGVKDFGSGQRIDHLHLSELPKFPAENQADLLISMFQTVPQKPGTAIIIEGTAKGIGGEFYKGFWACRYVYEIYLDEDHKPAWRMTINPTADPSNEYGSIFIPWFAFKEYRMPVDEDFVRTGEEEGWVKTFNLCDEQLAWYRWVLSNKCKGDLNKRNQEYPFTARGAFIGSGTPAFNVDRILFLKERCPQPIARYECLIASGQWVANPQGRLLVWEEPVPGRPYVVSADVAEGLAHGDFDSADVIDHMTGKQVAHFHGKMSPFDYAKLLKFLGQRYNDAWLVPERNNHGITVVEVLEDEEYPNLAFESVPDPPHKARKRNGFVTSVKSRKLILDILIEVTMQEDCGIQCADTFEEMLNFKIQDDGKMEADPGSHDDRVMSMAIAMYHVKLLDYAVPSRRPWLHGRGRKNALAGTRKPDPKGWT